MTTLNRLQDNPTLRAMTRACWPKEQHISREAAEAQVRSLVNRDLQKDNSLHPYRCPDCSQWHVGHRGEGATT